VRTYTIPILYKVAVLSHVAAGFLTANIEPVRYGTAHGSIVPYQAFKTKDEKYLIIGAGNNKQFRTLVKVARCDF
jgi:succinate--hydroxymethylglutarate CoA-transferase